MDTENDKVITHQGQKIKSIDLVSFNNLSIEGKKQILKEILEDIYGDSERVKDKHIEKCLEIAFSEKNEKASLPQNLEVEKTDTELLFYFGNKKGFPIILLIIGALLFASIGGTLATFIFFRGGDDVDVDIDGDGVADINIDLDGDGVADINIDLDGDGKPDVNVDYKRNRKKIFNIEDKGNKEPTYNLINQDLDNDGKCDLNCDVDDDGWPETNIDYDGDGIADIDIDKDGDKTPDWNIDTDGDGECNLVCDKDGDGNCDSSCIVIEKVTVIEKVVEKIIEKEIIVTESGEVISSGDGSVDVESAGKVILIYDAGNKIITENLHPDDQDMIQPGRYEPMEDKIVTIENISAYSGVYSLEWIIDENTFISDNFKYKIAGTNGAPSFDWITAPKENTIFVSNVVIPGKTIHKYTISFKLQGIHAPQDYDQNRSFKGSVAIRVE